MSDGNIPNRWGPRNAEQLGKVGSPTEVYRPAEYAVRTTGSRSSTPLDFAGRKAWLTTSTCTTSTSWRLRRLQSLRGRCRRWHRHCHPHHQLVQYPRSSQRNISQRTPRRQQLRRHHRGRDRRDSPIDRSLASPSTAGRAKLALPAWSTSPRRRAFTVVKLAISERRSSRLNVYENMS